METTESESGYVSANEKFRINTNTNDKIDSSDLLKGSTQPLDEIDEGTTGCNMVNVMIQMNGTDMYMAVIHQQIVVQEKVADPDSQNVLFNWINIPDTNSCIKLENDSSFWHAVVGTERFVNDTPLTLQNADDDKNNYVLYKRDSPENDYFALYLKSRDNNSFYILPSKVNKPLKIHSIDQLNGELKDKNIYVFKLVQSKGMNGMST